MAAACQPVAFLEAETWSLLILQGDLDGAAQDSQHGSSPNVTADLPTSKLHEVSVYVDVTADLPHK